LSAAAREWKVVVIVEDDSDGRALREIVRRVHPSVILDWLPANGIGNIKSRASQFIELARDRIVRGGGCIAVLVDADGKDIIRDEPHRTIASICKRNSVPLVLCKESLEAWFLSDPGCCEWLNIPLKSATHSIREPKEMVARAFFKKTRRKYQRRRARVELAKQMSGPDTNRNDSLAKALGLIERCVGRRGPRTSALNSTW
jgi:hypothetical protein